MVNSNCPKSNTTLLYIFVSIFVVCIIVWFFNNVNLLGMRISAIVAIIFFGLSIWQTVNFIRYKTCSSGGSGGSTNCDPNADSISYNGKCYQKPVTGTISFTTSPFGLQMVNSCPPGFSPSESMWVPGAGGPAYCTSKQRLNKGTIYCTNTSTTPEWSECTTPECQVQPVYAASAVPNERQGSLPIKYCSWPPPQ